MPTMSLHPPCPACPHIHRICHIHHIHHIPTSTALDDVDVAVRSRVVPIHARARVHDHDHTQNAHRPPPILAFHCVLVRHRWPSPVGQKVSSAVERMATVQPRRRRQLHHVAQQGPTPTPKTR